MKYEEIYLHEHATIPVLESGLTFQLPKIASYPQLHTSPLPPPPQRSTHFPFPATRAYFSLSVAGISGPTQTLEAADGQTSTKTNKQIMRSEDEELRKVLRLLKIGIALAGIAIVCSVWAIGSSRLCIDSIKALQAIHLEKEGSLFTQDIVRVRHTKENFGVLLESDVLTPMDIGIRKFAFMANAHTGSVSVIHRLVLGHDEARLAHHVSVWKSNQPIEFPITIKINEDTPHITKLRIEDKDGFRLLDFKDGSLIISNENNILSISGDPLNESASTLKYWLEQKTVESMTELYPDIRKLEGTEGWIYSARFVD